MCKVGVGSVSKILLMLTQSLYVVVKYKCSTLTSIYDFFVTIESYYYRHFTTTLSHLYVCMPFDYE